MLTNIHVHCTHISINPTIDQLHSFLVKRPCKQCCGSGSSIFSNCGSGSSSGSRVLMTKIEKIFKKIDQKLQFTYSWASIKDDQATGEAFSPQKRTSSNSKLEISLLFSFFVGHFCPIGSGDPDPAIQINADPVPQPSKSGNHSMSCNPSCLNNKYL
jgi:hypothetical protein